MHITFAVDIYALFAKELCLIYGDNGVFVKA